MIVLHNIEKSSCSSCRTSLTSDEEDRKLPVLCVEGVITEDAPKFMKDINLQCDKANSSPMRYFADFE